MNKARFRSDWLNRLKIAWQLPLANLKFFFVVLLVLGIFFRFVNLDHKIYWHDEAYTSLRVAGYTSREVGEQVFNGQVINVKDLEKYQRINPEKSLRDTIKSLEIDDAQHPPFYYILVRLWVRWFGNSITVTRSLSALFSALVFPCVYFLCLELFDSSLVGWVAIALISISPFHVLYAQEAREYSLWTLLILLASWALLKALRFHAEGRKAIHITGMWGTYASAIALGLYTFPFTGLVGVGHGIYVIVTERFRVTKSVIAYLFASLTAFLSFVPWLLVTLSTWTQTGATWTAVPIPFVTLLKVWGLHIERAFILTIGDFGFDEPLIYITLPFFLALTIYSIYFLCRHTPVRVWLFVLTLLATLSLFLLLPDLILGGQRSTAGRYLVPFYLGVQLSIAYLLATQIIAANFFKQKFWRIVMAIVITAGVISCGMSSQAVTSWNKVISYNNLEVARIINQAQVPLLISSSFGVNFGNTFALSYILDPKVKLQIVTGNTQPDYLNIPKIPSGFSDVFVLNPSDQFREKIEKEYDTKMNLLFNDSFLFLWKLTTPLR
ncbi:glycosyltransferase family 39 protein [Microcoleus sp. FACHB-SPT15]|uniref:glycosyltransferase family 39 protein n=1 Tax=Microcoleus sp. FACHB-SPT15 TaxID=2692830 RepID=UPI001784BB94|nr:glycosyltransferase family 39 protein [Microcoleus sp. FACHB-SPT15]MBD1804374.1 glycosyltransferase family 39 protein [Microcoleus sp. FACHB-SPT15]